MTNSIQATAKEIASAAINQGCNRADYDLLAGDLDLIAERGLDEDLVHAAVREMIAAALNKKSAS